MILNASTEPEFAALSAAMASPKALSALKSIPDGWFIEPDARRIKEAMNKVEVADIVTLNQEINKTGIDMTGVLLDVMRYSPIPSLINTYIGMLRNAHQRRSLQALATDLFNRSVSVSEDPGDLRSELIGKLRELDTTDEQHSITAAQAVDILTEYTERRDEHALFKTGIASFDKIFGGIGGSKLIVIGARPAVGKSALALQIALQGAFQGHRTLFCSLEMSPEEIMARALASMSNIALDKIERNDLDDSEQVALDGEKRQLAALPLHILIKGATVADIRREAIALNDRKPLQAIVVDYLQLLRATNPKENKNNQVSEISRDLRLLSMELKVPVFALSQLNRESDRASRKPELSDLRDSGAIEQDANIVILMHDPDERDLKRQPDVAAAARDLQQHGCKLVDLIVAKNRQGKAGCAYAVFDGAHMKFTALLARGKEINGYVKESC